jgi:putative membrane protein
MKKIMIGYALLGTLWISAGCGNTHKDSTAKADSINATNDSANKKYPGSPATEVSGDDAKFAVIAASGGMAEVELGKLAQQKAENAQVKDFGAMMVQDHSKANAALTDIAKSKNIALPASLGTDEQKLKADLEAKSGADFDKAYVQAMLDDHEKDIKDFEQASKNVKYPEMAAFINQTLPVLKKHLAAIQQIHDQMK